MADRRPSPDQDTPPPPPSAGKLVLGAAVLLTLAGAWWLLSETGTLSLLNDEQTLRDLVGGLGLWGPFAIIALLVAAILVSPIPSAPIAMAAGAAYGPVWGTLYTVAGAGAGAIGAFWIARTFGYGAVRRRLKGRLSFLTRERSQTALMAIVFASRLVPFLSFDAISYAAGLTPLTFWRFVLATFLGIVPISFLLTYFGGEITALHGGGNTLLTVLLLGGVTGIPIAGKLLWDWRKGRRERSRSVRSS